jgi:hypothetical protein
MSDPKLWDSTSAGLALKHSLQIKENIEELCYANTVVPSELPDSLLATDLLYNLVCCYMVMYDKILDNDLLKTANPKTNFNTSH